MSITQGFLAYQIEKNHLVNEKGVPEKGNPNSKLIFFYSKAFILTYFLTV